MSEIKTQSQNWAVNRKEDVIPLYEGALTNPELSKQGPMIGMEVEQNLYNLETLMPLTEKESSCFICEGREKAIHINSEPSATTLEILTDPFKPSEFDALIGQIDRRFDELWSLGLERGALPSPFSYLPHITPADHHYTQNQRYSAMWLSGRSDVIEARESFLDSSIQVSVSYKDFDHLLRIIRLSVVLEPFLILTTEADAGYFEGRPVPGSPRTRILKRRGFNGGIPDFYYTAKSGEEFIEAHIDFTLNNPHVFLCFDQNGTLKSLPQGVWTSFLKLEVQGYGPQDLLNYRQAQSESWRRTANISEIRNTEGTLFGHRAEISSLFCTGLQHQRASAAIISYHLAFCEVFYSNINELMKGFGIDMNDLYGCKDLLNQNFEAVRMHEGRYFNLPFGTKTVKDFAAGFAEMVQECFKNSALDKYSGPLMHILEQGRPDWLVNREIFDNLEQQKAYMKALPEIAKEHPELTSSNSCADFTSDIVRNFLAK